MVHKEYKRIIEHSRKAVLFIHGIVGTPNHFNAFLPLVPKNISLYNILLDGHGGNVRDFSKTSMQKWKQQVTLAVEELAQNHDAIYVVAHSLGALLAIEQAIYSTKISKLFLLAVPLKLSIKPKMVRNSLKVYFNKIDPKDEELIAAVECYGVANEKNPFSYIGWIPRFLELFSQIRYVRGILKTLQTPTVACQSCKDEMVSCKSTMMLEKNPNISVVELKNSGHYYYEKSDFFLLKDAFLNLFSM